MKPGRKVYRTITGRELPLAKLTASERRFLSRVRGEYRTEPRWSAFSAWWGAAIAEAKLGTDSLSYRICQDLEARLGIAQGKVASPDYRDYLADLIDERYGSRYRFCKETGLDPGHLSRVFASRAELSLQNLQKVLDALGMSLVLQPKAMAKAEVSPRQALAALAFR